MTDLIERYLAAVGRQLPAKQAVDIKAELRDVLLSRLEDQEARLGRALTRADVEALLIDFGNPLVVAGRYRKIQHLIGPEVFPFWWAAVKVMLAIVTGAYLVLIVLGVVTEKATGEFGRGVPSVWYVMVYLFGIITLVCAAIERFGKTQALQRWRPRNLPPSTGKPRSRFELAAEITWDLVFIAWWLGLFRFQDLMPAEIFLRVELAPVWQEFRWAIVGYASLEIAVDLLEFAWPGRVWLNSILSIARYGVGIGVLLGILQAGHWLVVNGEELPRQALETLQSNIDLGMKIGILGAAAAMVFRIVLIAWRLRAFRQAQGIFANAQT